MNAPFDAGCPDSDGPDSLFKIFADSIGAFIRRPFPIVPALLEKFSVACVTLLFAYAVFHVSYFSFLDVFGETAFRDMLTLDFLRLCLSAFIENIGRILLLAAVYASVRLLMSSVFFAGMIRSCLTIFGGSGRQTPLAGVGRSVKVFVFRLARLFLMSLSGVLFLPAFYFLTRTELSAFLLTAAAVAALAALPFALVWIAFVDFNLYLGPYILVIDGPSVFKAAAECRLMMKKRFIPYTILWTSEKLVALGLFALGLFGFSWLSVLISVFLTRPFFGFLLVRFRAGPPCGNGLSK